MAPTRYESSSTDVAPLGEPLNFAFAGRTAKNRFLKGAMTERLSSWSAKDLSARGVPSKELINVYRRWGEGQFGVILSGNIMIFPDHLEASGNPIITADAPFSGERFEAFADLIAQSKKHGSLYVAQVSHPGRQVVSAIQKDPLSASDVQLTTGMPGMSFSKPHAATQEEIDAVINGFAHAAEYLEKAGADGIQLHGAHGYLIAQFLASSTNKRTDKYGGSIENRARLITEIAEAVRKRTKPDFIMSIKLNSVEFQEGGMTSEEAKAVCQMLEEQRFDFVELSGGTYEQLAFEHKRESTKAREAFFLEFAEMIVPSLKQTKAYVTGGLRTAGAMVAALQTVDGVGLARPVCQEPRLPKDMLSGKVSGAIKQIFFADGDFMSSSMLAGAQMKQVGLDREPTDGSNAELAELYKKDLKTFMQGMADNADNEKYGYMDLSSLPVVPYGTAFA